MKENSIFSKNYYSRRLFCNGVPVKTIRRDVLILDKQLVIDVRAFFKICPSSATKYENSSEIPLKQQNLHYQQHPVLD